MILKTCRWKSKQFGRLIDYILTDKGRIEDPYATFTIYHNLPSIEADEIGKSFHENDVFRERLSKGKVTTYHEILSFAPSDREHINLELLEDIALQYIEIRNPKALCLAKPHIENDNVHIHFMFSGTELKSGKVLRMDNKSFSKVRRSIEAYQLEKYPELSNSIVYLNKPVQQKMVAQERDANTRKQKAFEMVKRVGEQSLQKEELKVIVQQCFNESVGYADFLQKIEQEGLSLYEYKGKVKGIIQKRKYRFTTLGIDKEKLQTLENKHLEIQARERVFEAIYDRKQKGLHPTAEASDPTDEIGRREQLLIKEVNRKLKESRDLDRD